MLTILNTLTKNRLILKTQTTHHTQIFVPYESSKNTSAIETRMSDFHKLVATVLQMLYKQKPRIIHYRNYKTFNEQLFRIELDKELAKIDLNNAELVEFYDEFLSLLNKHAP